MSARPLYLLFAILLAAAGLAAATWGRVQARLAQTELSMATQQYARADEELRGLEWLQRFASYLPAGREVLAEIRSRQAEIRYWQGDYRALVPAQGDPMAGLPADNLRLQALVANAVFRERYPPAKDQAARLEALDAAIAAQLTVLRNSPGDSGVAYNYEYLVRLRAVAAAKSGPPKAGPGGDHGALGNLGGEPQAADPTDFKIHIPLESRELQDQKEGREAGKTAPRPRQG
jgi:hypothetical protein